jgi:hypothetical protein
MAVAAWFVVVGPWLVLGVMLALPLSPKVIRERVDQLLDQLDGRRKSQIGDGVVVHLTVVADAKMPFDREIVDADRVRRAYDDLMTAVRRFAPTSIGPWP